jgi:crotonobetainyl-CoA:carnitine CoA-transferase CaiB-like acyl-CoA transferase
MQTLSGLVKIQGGDGRPIATAAPAHDVATGCLATVGTLAALRARRRRGYGQRVFTSLAAASTYLQSAELTSYRDRPQRRVGGPDFPGPCAFQRFYRAADRASAARWTSPLSAAPARSWSTSSGGRRSVWCQSV